MSRLKAKYREELVPRLMELGGFKNVMQVPRLVKITLNIGLGEAITNAKALEAAEGDLVAIHMPIEGTFTNELMGIPPNGKKVTLWMCNIWRAAEGKLVEWWINMDTLGLMQQLGAIPPMG